MAPCMLVYVHLRYPALESTAETVSGFEFRVSGFRFVVSGSGFPGSGHLRRQGECLHLGSFEIRVYSFRVDVFRVSG
jgi:hypothetical protein